MFNAGSVYHGVLGYLADECTLPPPPLAAVAVLCCMLTLLTIERAWSRDHATSLVTVTAVLPLRPPGQLWNGLPEQLRQPDITFGVRTIQTIVENVYVG